MRDGSLLRSLTGHTEAVLSVCISGDGSVIVSGTLNLISYRKIVTITIIFRKYG